MKRIGFTGTQRGMAEEQKKGVQNILFEMLHKHDEVEFHHGDCVGADADAHNIACERVGFIVIHPPEITAKRANCADPEWAEDLTVSWRRELPYLTRNKNIVDETELLIACPSGPEILRSGTWSTIRYARKLSVPITIIMPDGSIIKENH